MKHKSGKVHSIPSWTIRHSQDIKYDWRNRNEIESLNILQRIATISGSYSTRKNGYLVLLWYLIYLIVVIPFLVYFVYIIIEGTKYVRFDSSLNAYYLLILGQVLLALSILITQFTSRFSSATELDEKLSHLLNIYCIKRGRKEISKCCINLIFIYFTWLCLYFGIALHLRHGTYINTDNGILILLLSIFGWFWDICVPSIVYTSALILYAQAKIMRTVFEDAMIYYEQGTKISPHQLSNLEEKILSWLEAFSLMDDTWHSKIFLHISTAVFTMCFTVYVLAIEPAWLLSEEFLRIIDWNIKHIMILICILTATVPTYERIRKYKYNVLLVDTEDEHRFRLDKLIAKISGVSGISAGKFFALNRPFILTLASVLVTYMTVLVSFQGQSFEEAFPSNDTSENGTATKK